VFDSCMYFWLSVDYQKCGKKEGVIMLRSLRGRLEPFIFIIRGAMFLCSVFFVGVYVNLFCVFRC
jgi:hypothetical protein